MHAATLDRRLAAYGTAVGFVAFGLAATRSVASELSRVSLPAPEPLPRRRFASGVYWSAT